MTIGCAIIDRGLRDLGAGPRWFFSGGRGMHCWVTAAKSTSEFYSLSSSPDKSMRTALAERLAPASPSSMLERAVSACDPTAIWIVRTLVLPASPTNFDGGEMQQKFCGSGGLFLGWYAPRHPTSAVYALRISAARTTEAAAAESERRDVHGAIAELQAWSNELASMTLWVRAAAAGMRRLRAAAATKNCSLQNFLAAAPPGTRDEKTEADAAAALDRIFKRLIALATSEEYGITRMLRRRDPICMARVIAEAALMCMMPRIDRPVTEDPVHLLKAPLSVHPMSMRLAMEVSADGLADFFPWRSPILSTSKIRANSKLRWACDRSEKEGEEGDGDKIAGDALRKFDDRGRVL